MTSLKKSDLDLVSGNVQQLEKRLYFKEIDPIEEPFIGAWMCKEQQENHRKEQEVETAKSAVGAWMGSPRAKSGEKGAESKLASRFKAKTDPINLNPAELMERQRLLQTLYESRFAATERFIAFLVLFHAMGSKVEAWWPSASLGMLRYDMSRTQSIMRIATTASPVSGMEVRQKMMELAEETILNWAKLTMAKTMRWWKRRKDHESFLQRITAAAAATGTFTAKPRQREKTPGGFDPSFERPENFLRSREASKISENFLRSRDPSNPGAQKLFGDPFIPGGAASP